MTLEVTFYLSQTLASVAVVGSLVYLLLQVRYAERSQRGMMQQGRADRTSAAALTMAHADLARIWHKGAIGDASLSADAFNQWMLLCRCAFFSGEDSFMQHKAGLLSETAFDSYVAGVRHFMSMPGFRAAWQLTKGQFGQEFRDFCDAELTQTPVAPARDAYAEWKRLVQSEGDGARAPMV